MKLYDKIKEAMLNPKEDYCSLQSFAYEFGLNYDFNEEADKLFADRVKCYDIHTWYCTDETAGIQAYYMDGELVCIKSRPGRKYEWNCYWESNEQRLKLFDFIKSLPFEEERYDDDFAILNKEISYEEFCKINRIYR